MRKVILIVALAVFGVAMSSNAFAQDCKFRQFQVYLSDVALTTVPGYDACYEFPKAVGSISGRFIVCLNFAELRTNEDIWPGIEAPYTEALLYHAFLETSQGILEITFFTFWNPAWGEGGIGTIIGGTESFEGATGMFTYGTEFPIPQAFAMSGYICTPEG